MNVMSVKGICANIIQQMLGKPSTHLSPSGVRDRNRRSEIMDMCEAQLHLISCADKQLVPSYRELTFMVGNVIATVDAIRRHEIDSHKSLEE